MSELNRPRRAVEWKFDYQRDVDVMWGGTEPDPSWQHTDEHGHVHQWVDGEVPTTFTKEVPHYYEYPDDSFWSTRTERLCSQCLEEVEPGYRRKTRATYVPLITEFGGDIELDSLQTDLRPPLGVDPFNIEDYLPFCKGEAYATCADIFEEDGRTIYTFSFVAAGEVTFDGERLAAWEKDPEDQTGTR